jgi:hypothetical protein
MADKVLLLDLDGVVVFEAIPPLVAKREILRLHEGIEALLRGAPFPVVILTHRSRAEAKVVIGSAGLTVGSTAKIIAAEDLFIEACRHRQFIRLARQGLLKSHALKLVERLFGVPRGYMAIIDDKPHNLDDLLRHGVGMGLLAPSRILEDEKCLVTFSLAQALQQVAEWQPERESGCARQLPEISRPVAAWQRTGLDTSRDARHPFNVARRAVYAIRTVRAGGAVSGANIRPR